MWLAHVPGGYFVTTPSALVSPSPKNRNSCARAGLGANPIFSSCREGQKGFPVYARLTIRLENVPVAFLCVGR